MTTADRCIWAQAQTDQDLIEFARLKTSLMLPGGECYAVMLVLADRLERALGYGIDNQPIPAEAADWRMP